MANIFYVWQRKIVSYEYLFVYVYDLSHKCGIKHLASSFCFLRVIAFKIKVLASKLFVVSSTQANVHLSYKKCQKILLV